MSRKPVGREHERVMNHVNFTSVMNTLTGTYGLPSPKTAMEDLGEDATPHRFRCQVVSSEAGGQHTRTSATELTSSPTSRGLISSHTAKRSPWRGSS